MRRVIVFVLFFCGLVFPFGVFANTIFYDDFNDLNESDWNVTLNSGSTSYTTDGILFSSNLISFPFVKNIPLRQIIPNTGNFVLKIRFRYPTVASMGDGIGVGYIQNDGDTLIEFGVWQDSTMGFYYQTNNFSSQGLCSEIEKFYDNTGRSNVSLSYLEPNDWHVYELERIGEIINFYIDRDIYPIPLYSVSDFNCGGRDIFFGNNQTGGSHTWTSLEIDNVEIVDLGGQVDLSNKKVIIVPGLGASWNVLGALGSNDPNLIWKVPSFVKHYENLKNAFISNGYVEDENLFLWAYDWRKSVNQIVADFDNYISTVADGDDEIVVVGHSLGGLVARIWYQQNLVDTRIKNVISLGSPHRGSVDAYEAWNGGNVSRPGIHSIAFNLLVLLNKERTESIRQVIHRLAPVTKDLQPTLDFVYKNNSLVSYQDLTDFNSYLALQNIIEEDDLVDLHTFVGLGFDTKEFLTLGERTFFEKRLDIWPDGHLLNKTFSSYGDQTVLSASARMGNNFYEIDSQHGVLPDESIEQIMNILGLSSDGLTMVDYNNLDSSLVFYIASPAHLEVECGGQLYLSDEMGFVVVDKSVDFSNCSVDVVADGDGGNYKLVVGDSQNSWWSKFEGEVLSEQTDNYLFDKKAILVKDDNIFEIYRQYCLDLLDEYVGNDDLDKCLLACDNKDADLLIDSVFGFRDGHRDFNISWDMLDKLIPVLEVEIVDEGEANYILENGQDMFSLVDKVADLKDALGVATDDFGAESFGLAQKLFETASDDYDWGDYDFMKSRFNLAKMILEQVW